MRFCLSCSSENSEHSATWLFALERDSTLSSHSKQSFWFQIFHRIRKNKMANGKTKRVGHFHVGPLVLRGLKVAARITFLGANVAGAACRWLHRNQGQFSVQCSSFPSQKAPTVLLSPMSHTSLRVTIEALHTSAKLQQEGQSVGMAFAAPTNGAATGRCRS
jgi:hypothetical protein